MQFFKSVFVFYCLVGSCGLQSSAAEPLTFESQTLPIELSVGYAVRVLDVNGDEKLDIAIVDSKRIVWLEAPDWTTHVIYETPDAKNDNVCFAPHDINEDGLIDFAIGSDWQPNNTTSGGKIGWLENLGEGKWTYHAIAEEPTTHRMQWFARPNGKKAALIVAPLKGRGTTGPTFDQSGVSMLEIMPTVKDGEVTWEIEVMANQFPVMHNFRAVDMNDDGRFELLLASFRGVMQFNFEPEDYLVHLCSGQETAAPARGSSEVCMGRRSDRTEYIATIEPWHGDKVVVYTPRTVNPLWDRHVIDAELAWGHAIDAANLDADADEELVVGVRDNLSDDHRCGLRIYDPNDDSPMKWPRTIVEPGAIAVEDLTTADLDRDGDIDIIAVGRATHNAKVYWNLQNRAR
jgi:hypothetical protein